MIFKNTNPRFQITNRSFYHQLVISTFSSISYCATKRGVKPLCRHCVTNLITDHWLPSQRPLPTGGANNTARKTLHPDPGESFEPESDNMQSTHYFSRREEKGREIKKKDNTRSWKGNAIFMTKEGAEEMKVWSGLSRAVKRQYMAGPYNVHSRGRTRIDRALSTATKSYLAGRALQGEALPPPLHPRTLVNIRICFSKSI